VVDVVNEATDEVVEALQRLLPQLSRSGSSLRRSDIEAVIAAEACSVLVARDATGRIVGTLTLVVFRIPTGVRARIEDVIVDEQARGTGVGTALTEEALELARAAGARSVDLTSSPRRQAANALYRRAGFVERDTNVYRYVL
jgi:ribosomal protein S18 acetylase RimI-like enzyme